MLRSVTNPFVLQSAAYGRSITPSGRLIQQISKVTLEERDERMKEVRSLSSESFVLRAVSFLSNSISRWIVLSRSFRSILSRF